MTELLRRVLPILVMLLLAGVGGMAHAEDESKLINLNTATITELQDIKGIGHTYAERIIEARTEAKLTDLEDLQKRVKGIGPKTAENMCRNVTFDGKPLKCD